MVKRCTEQIALRLLAAAIAMTLPGSLGCQQWRTSGPKLDYKTVIESPLRDSATAEKRHRQAICEIEKCNNAVAEQLVQKALMADVSYGPAHNTLGKLYFDQNKYYLAAWEFEYAANSMPERAEPKNNLGLVYEAVERLDEAIFEYQTAHDLEPENPEYFGNLLRARIRKGEEPTDLRQEFKQLLFIETRPTWQKWCRKNLAFTEEGHRQLANGIGKTAEIRKLEESEELPHSNSAK